MTWSTDCWAGPRRFPEVDHAGGREFAAAPEDRLHRPLPGDRPSTTTDVKETLGALTDLVRQGKVRSIGSSSYSAELALAWAINHPGVTSVIIGPRTMEQLGPAALCGDGS